MKIEFVEKNYDIGTRLKDLIQKKIDKLDRYFGDEAIARVACSCQNKNYKLELTILNKGLLYRAEVTGENMYENIDFALPKIERQIIRQGDKKKSYFKSNAFDFADMLFLEEKPVEKSKEVYKKKTFNLDPITVEDAQYFLDAIDHDFYVFLNAETGKVNVLYKRKDGKLGLIECNY